MLHLDRGRGMRHLVDELERRRFRWAYRVVDTRAFGLPQRRHRVILLASRSEDPRNVLFVDEALSTEPAYSRDLWCGFYWTEGLRGLGWAVDAVPTLKGGSTIGIPSPPAIWIPATGEIGTPDIRDAERLQGFEVDWSLPALEAEGVSRSHRWKLVGNAVSVPLAKWVGERLAHPGQFDRARSLEILSRGISWPKAAWGHNGRVHSVSVSTWPVRVRLSHLSKFIKYPLRPLSVRAAAGFKSRMDVSSLNFEDDFRRAVGRYVTRGLRTAVA
jgi:DNA (cytosine-5)-methyltransferase 1